MRLILFKHSEKFESVAPLRSMAFAKFLGKISHALRVKHGAPDCHASMLSARATSDFTTCLVLERAMLQQILNLFWGRA